MLSKAALPRPALSVQTSILYGLRQVFGLYIFAIGKVGYGAAHFKYAVIGARAQVQPVHRCFQKILAHTADHAYFF